MRGLPPLSRTRLPAQAGAAHSPRLWAVAGAVCGGLIAAVFWAPASWVAQAVQSATQNQVQLQEARGTVWNGSARLIFTGGVDSRDLTALPSRLNWSLRPSWTGAQLSLQSDCCTSAPVLAHVYPGWNQLALKVNDSQIQLSADMLSGLGTPWNTMALQGQLNLSTSNLNLQYHAGRMVVQGRTRLEALSVSSRLSPLRPLGSYRLDIDGGESTHLNLSTLNGDLRLSGQGQWVGSRLHFNGEASASPDREAALSNLLNILGRRQGTRSIITFG